MSIEKTEQMEDTAVPANYWLDRARCKVGTKMRLVGGNLKRLYCEISMIYSFFNSHKFLLISATDRSLVQRSPTDCGVSLCVITKPRKRGG